MAEQTSPGAVKEPLVLKVKDLRKNTLALFEEIERNEKVKEQFIQDPVGILEKKVFKRRVPAQRTSEANRLLFSLFANEKLLRWLDRYAQEHREERVSKDQFNQEFAKALVEFGDENVFLSILRNIEVGSGIPGFGDRAQQLIINNAAGQAVATPVNQPSTSDQTLRSSQNFNGIGLGDPRINPALVRAVVEQLINHARELSRAGKLADSAAVIR